MGGQPGEGERHGGQVRGELVTMTPNVQHFITSREQLCRHHLSSIVCGCVCVCVWSVSVRVCVGVCVECECGCVCVV